MPCQTGVRYTLQVNSRPIFPGAAMFEAARAAGATLGTHNSLPEAALQEAAIPAPLLLQKPQVSMRAILCTSTPVALQGSSRISMPVKGVNHMNWRLFVCTDLASCCAEWSKSYQVKMPCGCGDGSCAAGICGCSCPGHDSPSESDTQLHQQTYSSGLLLASGDKGVM